VAASRPDTASTSEGTSFSATWILIALAVGLVAGIASAASGGAWVDAAVSIAEPIGDLWLRALQMTIVPLVVALLITGIASAAEAARAGRLAGRALVLILAVLWSSSVIAAVTMPLLLNIWPLPTESAEALRAALRGSEATGQVPGIGEFLRSIVPTNPLRAAADDAILPLIVFVGVFAFAITRLPGGSRRILTDFFSAVTDAMLIVINWVLALAPIGVAALAFVVGALAGGAALGALLHYVVIVSAVGAVVWLLAYPLGAIGGRVGFGRFARAVAPSQAVAIGTRSSLASLPAMLKGAQALGVPDTNAEVVLPLAVALFRATGPAMNLAVALYIAHWYGIELGPAQLAAGIAAGAITTMGAVSLPGQVSFYTSIAPICLALGVPVEPLGLLVAVETIPDIMRTLGNVTADVAVTATVSAREGGSTETIQEPA
jgi:proton glutamate symport protein